MERLIPCGTCSRHVKASEGACPFCRAPTAIRSEPATRPYRRMVAAATVAASVVACSADAPSVTVFYGSAQPGDASTPEKDSAVDDSPSAVAFYGSIRPLDSSTPEDAASEDAPSVDATSEDARPTDSGSGVRDASVEDSPSVIAFYGSVNPIRDAERDDSAG